ncbi:MAG TPA: hypothetical protein VNU46_02215 [Gemmatimonadaceae bacterium]|jgi:hypothetical protein|nr:hypothetical protein [Gemmatimonadaceae bacterium]
MHDPLEGDLLDRYLAGTLSPEEAERVRVFLDTDATRRGIMAGVRAWMRGEDLGGVPYDVTLSLRELAVQIDEQGEARSSSSFAEVVDREGVPLRLSDSRHPVALPPTIPGIRGAGQQPLRRGLFKGQPLRRVVRALFDELTSLAVALIERRDTELNATEIKRLRDLVERLDPEEK